MDNKLKIINYLGKHLNKSFTMLELSKATKIPYATFYRTIEQMKNVVTIQIVGKAKTVTLNTDNPVIKSYLTISSEEEKKEFLEKQPILKKIATELNTTDIIVLFGSYARGTERTTSDIDILVINKKGEKSLSFSKYELLFKKKINPLFMTKSEFMTMLHEKEENVGKQTLENHIILNNSEHFWECVLHG